MLDNVLGFKPQQRIMVVELTDWKEWNEQVETFYLVRPIWGLGHAGDPNATYYRVRFHTEGTRFLPRAAARIIDFVLLLIPRTLGGMALRFFISHGSRRCPAQMGPA
jgi:hypothetical protein